MSSMRRCRPFLFQSTLLMRGATFSFLEESEAEADISIHAPHARSDVIQLVDILSRQISIHAPHARSDPQSS